MKWLYQYSLIWFKVYFKFIHSFVLAATCQLWYRIRCNTIRNWNFIYQICDVNNNDTNICIIQIYKKTHFDYHEMKSLVKCKMNSRNKNGPWGEQCFYKPKSISDFILSTSFRIICYNCIDIFAHWIIWCITWANR